MVEERGLVDAVQYQEESYTDGNSNTPERTHARTRWMKGRSCHKSRCREEQNAHQSYSVSTHPQGGTGAGYVHNGGYQKPAAPKTERGGGQLKHVAAGLIPLPAQWVMTSAQWVMTKKKLKFQ